MEWKKENKMLTSNNLDPERVKLETAVTDLMERSKEILDLLQASSKEVSQSGEIKVEEYKTAKESCELYKDISEGLKVQLDAAQLELWNYDLHKAEMDFKLALAKATECRTEILTVTTDKTNYIRSANADRTTNPVERADRISAYEVLMVDARNRSRQAEQRRDQLKAKFEQLKREYNDHAVEIGGETRKMSTLESYFGHS
jgi:hypothetical protein